MHQRRQPTSPAQTEEHHMSSRELREKMSHDPLLDGIKWFDQNKSRILTIVVVCVAVYAIAMLVKNRRFQNTEKAVGYYNLATQTYQDAQAKQGDQKTQTLEEAKATLDQLIREYGDTPQGRQGMYFKGHILYEQGEYEPARELFDRVVRDAKNSTLSVMARIGSAQCVASIDGPEAGVKAFQDLLGQVEKTPFGAQVKFQLAELLRISGQEEQAVKLLESLDKESPLYDEASQKLDYLKAPVGNASAS